MKKISKPNIALFYIALMLLFKVAGLHVLTTHNDDTDSEHCEVCHITTAVNFTPLLEADTPEVLQTEYFLFEQKLNSTTPNVVFNNNYLSRYLFTRPPPQFL